MKVNIIEQERKIQALREKIARLERELHSQCHDAWLESVKLGNISPKYTRSLAERELVMHKDFPRLLAELTKLGAFFDD